MKTHVPEHDSENRSAFIQQGKDKNTSMKREKPRWSNKTKQFIRLKISPSNYTLPSPSSDLHGSKHDDVVLTSTAVSSQWQPSLPAIQVAAVKPKIKGRDEEETSEVLLKIASSPGIHSSIRGRLFGPGQSGMEVSCTVKCHHFADLD
ncbi:hypothetical protein CEXT_305471 [Caerostris extrusa]|uniref:Uncharacterized protein n=1 Tax=Caerostris extrusa TaxID=172846 RepID=A0AAV4RP65_CAEEX|nr:hypothetical protein CEXT_305471 [Caerostris extrusa]